MDAKEDAIIHLLESLSSNLRAKKSDSNLKTFIFKTGVNLSTDPEVKQWPRIFDLLKSIGQHIKYIELDVSLEY